MRSGFLLTVSLLALCGVARADDITLGGDARAFAMGGAGVATNASGGGATRNNVASLAFDRGNVRVYTPNLGIRQKGAVKQSNGLDYLLGLGSLGQAAKLVQEFGSTDSTFALNASAGVRVGHLEILTNGVGTGRVRRSGTGAEVQIDGAYALPSIGFASVIPGQKGRMKLAVGGRIKYANVVYSRLLVDSSGNATPAPEMNGRETDTRQGVAADLGLMWKEDGDGPLSLGIAVSNLIKPRGGNPAAGTLVTTASLGAGYVTKDATFAVDVVDITAIAGKAQVRTGAEVLFGPLPVRAGYSSATGFTYGTRLLGLDLAFSKRAPLEIGRTIRF
jgi:hypothetical protein